MSGLAFSDSRRGKCPKNVRLADRADPSLDQAKRLGNLLGGSAKCELTAQETDVSAVWQDSGRRQAVVEDGLVVGSGRWLGP